MKLLSAFTENPEKICKETGIPLPTQDAGTSQGFFIPVEIKQNYN